MTSSIVRVLRGGLVLAALLALAACGGKGAPPPPSAPTLTAIALSPASVSLPKGTTVQVAAVGTWSDGSTGDVTAQAAWSAGDPTVATVVGGLVTGVGIGGSSIKATLGGLVGTGNAVVSAPTLTGFSLSPASASLPAGGVVKLAASAAFGDGSSRDVSWEATWVSGTPASVVVSGNGRALAAPGVTSGSSVITATYGGMSATSTLTVSGRAAIGPGASNDPLLPDEWYLKNSGQKAYADVGGTAGQDIATATTYGQGWSGAGVKVGVVDTGLEIRHEDLADNVVPGSWNFLTGTPDPTSSLTTGDHGTAVAGLIAMVQGNGKGGMGVSPAAALNGYNFISSSQTLAQEVASLGGSSANPKSDDVWVFNQSYGYDNTSDFLVDPTEEAQYLSGVTTLRGGKGALYVKAAGNGFRSFGPYPPPPPDHCAAARALGTSCQNASMDPLNTLPYNVVVGAVNANGVRSSYSTAGSAIWVAAPGGEYGLNVSLFPVTSCIGGCPPYAYEPAMVTTDQSGCSAGWSVNTVNTGSFFDNGNPPNTSCNYTATMNGTSSATPVTVGAIALILERNPNLGWRDVKHILATTATQVDSTIAPVTVALTGGTYTAELGWTTNAAGRKFHNWYGFGRVNVDAALAAANGYTAGQLGTYANTGWLTSGAISVSIPDNSVLGAPSTINVPASPTPPAFIEAVQINVSATHPYTGDLGIELTSPAGTKSILMNIRNGFNGTTGLSGMVLTSNAFYGESGAGNWTLKVVDGSLAHGSGTLTNWQIRIFGH